MKSLRHYIDLLSEAPTSIDVRPIQQAAKVKAYQDAIAAGKTEAEAQNAEAAAGNLAGAEALQQQGDAAGLTSTAAVATPVPEPTATVAATPAPVATQPAAPKQWNKGVLGVGSAGKEVEDLQRRLGITPDGKYGPATRDAVIALQKRLGVTPDGAYGPQTRAAHDNEPKGIMGPRSTTVPATQPAPVATQPAPVATQPAPVATQPAPAPAPTPAQTIQTAVDLKNAATQGAGWDKAGGTSNAGGAAFGNPNLARQGANARANQASQQLKTQVANAATIANLQKEITGIQTAIANAKAAGDTRGAQDYAIQLQGAQADLAKLQPTSESQSRYVQPQDIGKMSSGDAKLLNDMLTIARLR